MAFCKKIKAYISKRKKSNQFACKYTYEQLKMHYLTLRQIAAKMASDDLILEGSIFLDEMRNTLNEIKKAETMLRDSGCDKIKL
jgi:hypothetical protein